MVLPGMRDLTLLFISHSSVCTHLGTSPSQILYSEPEAESSHLNLFLRTPLEEGTAATPMLQMGTLSLRKVQALALSHTPACGKVRFEPRLCNHRSGLMTIGSWLCALPATAPTSWLGGPPFLQDFMHNKPLWKSC